MLTAEQYLGWHQALQLRPAAVEFIDLIRASPPVRRVTSGHRNVSGSYPSAKMGLTIQFESHTNQFAAVLEYEQHDDDVLEYWASRTPLQLSLKARNGKTITLAEYVPAFFVLRTKSAAWVDCIPARSIEKRIPRWPDRYPRDRRRLARIVPAKPARADSVWAFQSEPRGPRMRVVQRNLDSSMIICAGLARCVPNRKRLLWSTSFVIRRGSHSGNC